MTFPQQLRSMCAKAAFLALLFLQLASRAKRERLLNQALSLFQPRRNVNTGPSRSKPEAGCVSALRFATGISDDGSVGTLILVRTLAAAGLLSPLQT